MLQPVSCPRCGRPSRCAYTNSEAKRQKAPLCSLLRDDSCPGFAEFAKEVTGQQPRKRRLVMSDTEFAIVVLVCGTHPLHDGELDARDEWEGQL